MGDRGARRAETSRSRGSRTEEVRVGPPLARAALRPLGRGPCDANLGRMRRRDGRGRGSTSRAQNGTELSHRRSCRSTRRPAARSCGPAPPRSQTPWTTEEEGERRAGPIAADARPGGRRGYPGRGTRERIAFSWAHGRIAPPTVVRAAGRASRSLARFGATGVGRGRDPGRRGSRAPAWADAIADREAMLGRVGVPDDLRPRIHRAIDTGAVWLARHLDKDDQFRFDGPEASRSARRRQSARW